MTYPTIPPNTRAIRAAIIVIIINILTVVILLCQGIFYLCSQFVQNIIIWLGIIFI